MKKTAFFLTALFCFSVFLVHFFLVGTAIYGDGRYYYATARSVAFDFDLKYFNEYTLLNVSDHLLPTGFIANKYTIGPSLFWIPVVFLTREIITILSYTGINLTNNGFTFPFQVALGLETIILSIIGVYLLYRTLLNFFSEKVSFLTALGILFTTNLFFYTAIDPLNSHALSFFAAALFFWLLFTFPDKNLLKKYLLLGFTAGLIALIRLQDLLLVIPTIYLLCLSKIKFTRKILVFWIFILSVILVFLPQVFIWKTIYGAFLNPYLGGIEGFSFLRPQISGVLLNPQTGLILWTPAVLLALVGLFYLKKEHHQYRNIFLISVILEFYSIASWSSWNQGASFGTRMLISCLPILAFGYARLIEISFKKFKNIPTYYLLIFLTIINCLSIIRYLIRY